MAPPEQVREQVDRILGSQWFAGAERRGRLLRYLVEQALAGDRGAVKESVLAAEVFERGTEYDSRIDSLVRMEVGRLRSKLAEYYVHAGQGDAVRIEIPKGSYLPQIDVVGQPAAPVAPAPAPIPPAPVKSRKTRWLALAAAALLAVGAAWWWRGSSGAEVPSVAILPFLNLTGDPAQEYLSDSITDELTEALAETKGMRVVARTSAFQFKGKAADVREIGKRLNVSALLEGSVKRDGGALEMVVQLIRTSDGYRVWSKTFDAADRDLRGVETEIAASTERVLLPGQVRPGGEVASTSNAEAHNLYLQAVYLFHKGDVDSLRKCLELAREAVKLDPSFVRAHWIIVKGEQNLAAQGAQSTSDSEAHSAQSWAAILALDPGSADAHTQIGFRAYVLDWDWPRAEAEFRAALASGGSHGNAHNIYGWCLMTRGRFADAHRHFDAALEIDPLVQMGARANSAIAWLLERKYENARRVIDSILQLNPQSAPAYGLLGWTELAHRDCAGLETNEKKIWELTPSLRGVINPRKEAICGKPEVARAALAKSGSEAGPYTAPYSDAEAYALLGDADHTVESLTKAADARSDTVLYLQLDPLLERVRQDARIQALAKRIGLEE